ncbi:MAG TPA: glycosyltransferase family 9 protein [Acetobacteraceae bacterium]
MAPSVRLGGLFQGGARRAMKQRRIGEEASKTLALRLDSGFIDKYLFGPAIMDIGYRGYIEDVVPVVPQAIGIELDYPGYDGRTLPFAEGSQDAVFASHCLEHIPDFKNAFRDWFRVLRVGGFLVIAVPHAFLYEKRVTLPSRFNADHKRFYTPASLLAELQDSLEPNSYRIRHMIDNDLGYDYSIGPDRHAGGCYEIELVVEKIARPGWRLAAPGDGLMPPAEDPLAAAKGALRALQRPAAMEERRRILVLKLDHLGDFLIGMPALRALRADFPDAEITLICGSWNRISASEIGVFDRIETYDFFPRNLGVWDGEPHTPIDVFKRIVAGRYDVAIDMRVPDDTRFLLQHVDAAIRCGLGSVATAPYLDIALPLPAATDPVWDRQARRNPVLPASKFLGRSPAEVPFYMVTDFSETDNFVFWGPYIALPEGEYDVTFHFVAKALDDQPVASAIEFDIARSPERLAVATLDRNTRDALQVGRLTIHFANTDEAGLLEFRTRTIGKHYEGSFYFLGVTVTCTSHGRSERDRATRLHMGEQLSLLEHLMHERVVGTDYPAALRSALPLAASALALLQAGGGTTGLVCLAPLSNSSMRDWPLDSYARLARMIRERLGRPVALLGSAEQHVALNEIVFACDNDPGVINLAGVTPWGTLPTLFAQSALVIANNSGIAHYAAACAAKVLVLFSGSHVVEEWAPRGRDVTTITFDMACSPCHSDAIADCVNEHACMVSITPEMVFDRVATALQATEGHGSPSGAIPSAKGADGTLGISGLDPFKAGP